MLLGKDGTGVQPIDFSEYPDWVLERVKAARIRPDHVYGIVVSHGALGPSEPVITRIDIGYMDHGGLLSEQN